MPSSCPILVYRFLVDMPRLSTQQNIFEEAGPVKSFSAATVVMTTMPFLGSFSLLKLQYLRFIYGVATNKETPAICT